MCDLTLVRKRNETFLIRTWKPLSSRRVLKSIHNGPKRPISANGGLGLLQMVSELDTGWCASEDVGTPRGMDYEIPHWLERGTKHSL